MTTLKNVLLINALSSGATGLLLIEFPSFTAQLFGVSQSMPFMATGIFLVAFSLLVYYASRQKSVNKTLVRWIIALDIMWVVDSLIVVGGQLFDFTLIGYALTSAVALWVALMAFLQIRGLKERLVLKTE
ncbi:hypothetical protein [Emticicia sp. C21]|uniref:hypothetical protein n=1 Tax=Emticicia sp. C21 TaxID=2302915 RepID=UPI000E351A3D|nr:hypothetical protein [Emticicia sp. C21]RFS15638.1 hypothetical protein D0T08_15975 [Emticicia sp. C21]